MCDRQYVDQAFQPDGGRVVEEPCCGRVSRPFHPTRSIKHCETTIERGESDQERPKDNDSVDRRAGVELGHIQDKRGMYQRADLRHVRNDGRRLIGWHTHDLRRYAGRREDRVAAAFRADIHGT